MPKLEWLCRIDVSVGPLIVLGMTPMGERRVVPILGGTVRGAGFDGEVLPGGADWQFRRADEVLEISAHYALRFSDGAIVEVHSDGYRHGPPEAMTRLAAGEPVPPEAYFFKTVLRFRTGAPAHLDLNRTIAVADAQRGAHAVRLEVHRLL